MPKRILIMLCIIFLKQLVNAQGVANIWHFGSGRGLDFSGGAPVIIGGGQTIQIEGNSSICDASGNLLFYTDGIKVWDKNHVQMPNGNLLNGGNGSSTQSCLIVPKPGSSSIFYVFTSDYEANPKGICFSEVDLTLNGGLGAVTANKNILLNTPSCEKLAGIRHCNNEDVWVVTHDWNSDAFRAYLVTSAGVNAAPVISNAGLVISGNPFNATGHLKASPDGTKLACATGGTIDRIELFDFDNSTGIVSNPLLLQSLGEAYGVEFSPDGTKLYCSTTTIKEIYQFNLCANSPSAIANSGTLIGVQTTVGGTLQQGPDGKIYCTRMGQPWLAVIDNPNALGVACNFIYNGISLGTGGLSLHSLPNFISDYFLPTKPPLSYTYTMHCDTGNFVAPTVNTINCTNAPSAILSLSWNFGDPASGSNNTSSINNPSHIFTTPGNYFVSLILNFACHSDTITQNVIAQGATITSQTVNICAGTYYVLPDGDTTIFSGVYVDTVSSLTSICDSVIVTTLNFVFAVYTNQNFSMCNGDSVLLPDTTYTYIPGTFSDTLPAHGGCDSIITTVVNLIPNATFVQNVSFCVGSYYVLPDGDTAFVAGTFTDSIPGPNGCDSIITTNVSINNLPGITPGPTLNLTCLITSGTISATASSPSSYTWNGPGIVSGGTTNTPTINTIGTYTVTITDSVTGCTNTATVTVTSINPLPTITTISPIELPCNPNSVTLSSSSTTAGVSYSWAGPNIVSGNTTNAPTVDMTGTYTVTVTDPTSGCTNTSTVVVTNAALPNVSTSPADLPCNPALQTISASSTTPAVTYNWQGTGITGSTSTSSTTVNSTGSYTVTVTDPATGCTNSTTTVVNNATPPSATVSADVTITAGQSTVLTASGGTNYRWFPSTALNNTNSNTVVASPIKTITYCVEVTDNNGCKDTACVTVEVERPCPSNDNLPVPNAFSPNFDEINDWFCLQGWDTCIDHFSIQIYDRWGTNVFQSDNPNFCWNGTYKGVIMDPGVFVYYINATFKSLAVPIEKTGNISLIR